MTADAAVKQQARMMPWWLILLEGIAAVIVGFFLLTSPQATMFLLVQFLGIYWFVAGIFSIVSIFIDSSAWGWKLFVGILGIIAGIIIIRHPLWSSVIVQATLIVVLGIEGLIIGVIKLIQAFQGAGWGVGILGALSIIVGIYLLANVLLGALVLPWVLGVLAVAGGILAIIAAFQMK